MSFIDKIKSVFIVQDNQSPKQVSSETSDSSNSSTANAGLEGGDQKFYELLTGILEKNNFPGYDYFEFKKSLQSVAKLGNMDEAMMYKTVFATAQSMQVDAEHLVNTAKNYLNILENEQSKFHKAADTYLSEQVQSKNTELSSLSENLNSNKVKWEELKKEIENQESRLKVLSEEIEQTKLKISNSKKEFGQQYLRFVEEIKTDIEKMNKHLA